jgi:tetratricopeptide (TPR) repeat protein/O-antigen ligase
LPERPDASSLPDVRELAAGVGLGSGLLAATVLTMRPLLFGFQDPSASNALVTAIAALLACTVLVKSLLETRLNLPPLRVAVPLGFVLFLGLVTSTFGAHRWPAEKALLAWATNAIVFLSVFALASRGRIGSDGVRRAVAAAILATAALVALYGVWQRIVGLDMLRETLKGTAVGEGLLAIPGAWGRAHADEIFATFVYPNALAGYLGLVLPLAAGAALAARAAHEMVSGLLAWGLTALLGIALVLTGSLGGWMAAAAGLAVFGLVLKGQWLVKIVRARLPETTRARRSVLGAGAAIVLVAVLVGGVLFMRTSSMRYRLEYWRAGTAMLAAKPMGVGLGNFADHYTRFKTPAGTEVREPHNVYLGIAVEAGPVALIAFGFLVIGFARACLWPRGSGKGTPTAPAAWLEGLSPWRTLALVGGLSGAFAAFVASAATESGVQASSIGELLGGGADSRTVFTAVYHLAFFPVWGLLFWFFFRMDAGSRAVRAGILGGIAAVLVHGMVDFDFSVKATMLTAAAMGGLALADGERTEVPMRGGTGLAVALAVAAGLGLVLWRGSKRMLDLWGNSVVARSADDRATEFEWLYRRARSFSYQRNPDARRAKEIIERAIALDLNAAAADAGSAVVKGDVGAVSSAFRRLASEARVELERALRKSWDFRTAYLRMEPGDEEEVKRLGGTSYLLGQVAPDVKTDRATERAFEELTKRSPESYVGWALRGHFERRHGHMPRAAAFYVEAAARYPLRPELWLFLGDARASFDPKLAREAYARALEVNRVIEDYNTILFAKLWESRPVEPVSGELLGALEHAEEELGPTPEIAFRRGLVYISVGGYTEAAADFAKALELRPGDVQLALFRALALEMLAARLEVRAEKTDKPEDKGAAEKAKAAAHEELKAVDELQRTAPPRSRIPESVMTYVHQKLPGVAWAATLRSSGR